jgi:hypothetical protein
MPSSLLFQFLRGRCRHLVVVVVVVAIALSYPCQKPTHNKESQYRYLRSNFFLLQHLRNLPWLLQKVKRDMSRVARQTASYRRWSPTQTIYLTPSFWCLCKHTHHCVAGDAICACYDSGEVFEVRGEDGEAVVDALVVNCVGGRHG